MTEKGFRFDEARRRFPAHWDETGWATSNSTWRATSYPHLRVRVIGRTADSEGSTEEINAMIYWGGGLEGLAELFTYESTDRWNIQPNGLIYGPAGINREGRWAREGDVVLTVTFDRAMFGGPDTWHINFGENIPFFEPVEDWDHR